ETRATPAGGGWILRGEKVHVLDGHVADRLIVSARTNGAPHDVEGITLFLVRPDAHGVRVTRQTRLDGQNAALVRLEDTPADRHTVLGEVDRGGAPLTRVIDRATAALTAEMLGSMTAPFALTIDHLNTPARFGAPMR